MFRQFAAVFALAAAALLGSQAQAFDTGPHTAITEQAMAMAGYSRPAADVVTVENWLTDYYVTVPTRGDVSKCNLEKLHFDTLFTPADVDAYWNTLLENTIRAALKAKKDNDRLEFYTVLGVSLHALQDFYTHSNWVETSGYKGSGFDTTTYFQWRQGGAWKRDGDVHTGWYGNCLNYPAAGHDPHGNYDSGMNHDSISRPNYSKAYVYALSGSYEWLKMVRQALIDQGGQSFADDMLDYIPNGTDAGSLARDQAAALYISEWIFVPFKNINGHWNGEGSGNAAAIVPTIASWSDARTSDYVKAFKANGVVAELSKGLYAKRDAGAITPAIQVQPLLGNVVDLKVGKVCTRGLNPLASYFGTVTPEADGESRFALRGAAMIRKDCPTTNWEYLFLVRPGPTSAKLNFALFDETGEPGQADKVTFDGGDSEVNIACDLASGVCTWGGANGAAKPMPDPLNLEGRFWSGVKLGPLSVSVTPAVSGRP